jgi:hypothetical protein
MREPGIEPTLPEKAGDDKSGLVRGSSRNSLPRAIESQTQSAGWVPVSAPLGSAPRTQVSMLLGSGRPDIEAARGRAETVVGSDIGMSRTSRIAIGNETCQALNGGGRKRRVIGNKPLYITEFHPHAGVRPGGPKTGCAERSKFRSTRVTLLAPGGTPGGALVALVRAPVARSGAGGVIAIVPARGDFSWPGRSECEHAGGCCSR